MKSLAHLATRPAVLNAAWRHVSHQRGVWRPGVALSRVQHHVVRHVGELAEALQAGEYRPDPPHRFSIMKGDGSLRQLASYCLRDRLAQRAVLLALSPRVEPLFHEASYAFRPLCSSEMAVCRAREWIRRGYIWLAKADIAGCFDAIPHAGVLARLADAVDVGVLLPVLEAWMGADADGAPGGDAGIGLIQGMVLSPLFCNLYLNSLDWTLAARDVPFVRYADDILLFAPTRALARRALDAAEGEAHRLHLALNSAKTSLALSSRTLRFLGRRMPGILEVPGHETCRTAA